MECRRHPFLTALAALPFLGLAAPLLAFVIAPSRVKSTLVEDPPPDPGSSGSATIQTVRQRALAPIDVAHYLSGVMRIVQSGAQRFASGG